MGTVTQYRAGDRVHGTVYGIPRTGTVTEDRGFGVTWVRWDHAPETPRWMHTSSLEVLAVKVADARALLARAEGADPHEPYNALWAATQRVVQDEKEAGRA